MADGMPLTSRAHQAQLLSTIMSQLEDGPSSKKRRVQRACDICRHRRKACDGLRSLEKKCTNCIDDDMECTFSGFVASRRSYVSVLETRLELMEQLLAELSAQGEASASSVTSRSRNQWSKNSPILDHASTSASAISTPCPGVELAALTIRSMNTPAPEPYGDDLEYINLMRHMEYFSIEPYKERMHGKSSMAMLLKAAVLLRMDYEERELLYKSRRMRYCTFDPAKEMIPHSGPFVFPEPDLLTSLVALYFARSNLYYPVLHCPTFERLVGEGLHQHDDGFASVLLVVCAIGSRFSDDPRIFQREDEDALQCGWMYFGQVANNPPQLFARPTLYNLQYYALAAIFVESSSPGARSSLIGVGLRLAMDVGAHRASPRGARVTVESELWKRALWVLVILDRLNSSGSGRPCTTQYEELDVELPIECDDEYWEATDPSMAFKQPSGKPSNITYFLCLIRLSNILAITLKTLYALNKTKALLATRDERWEEHIVVELENALTDWAEALPTHLRWDPNNRDEQFLNQSAYLYTSYYWLQMTLHRPLIMKIIHDTDSANDQALQSIATCTNAARSCAHICEVLGYRNEGRPVPQHIPLVFGAALILLLNVWSGKRTGLPPQMNTGMLEVHKCMEYLRVCEKRWQTAGLFCDGLHEIAQLQQLPLSAKLKAPPLANGSASDELSSHKRGREEDLETYASDLAAPPAPYPPYIHRAAPASTFPPDALLPTYISELERLPILNQYAATDVLRSSSWYPQQTSTAPLGCPDFTITPLDNPMLRLFAADANMSPLAERSGHPANNVSATTDGPNNNVIAVWAKAPTGFEVDEWGTYFRFIREIGGEVHS